MKNKKIRFPLSGDYKLANQIFYGIFVFKSERLKRYLFMTLLLGDLILMTFLILGCQSMQPASQIEMASLFTNHMVLQQELSVPVWGKANPGGLVTVSFNDQKIKTIADEAGNWMVRLKPLKAGGPFQMQISGKDTLTIHDILVGEVWIGSGQSNMEMPLAGWGQILNYEQEIAQANYPKIRLFQVERSLSLKPKTTVNSAGWSICSPESIPAFSATAYFFGRELHKELNIPIGLIHSSWGGTIIEAWMSAQALDTIPEFKKRLEQMDNLLQRFKNQIQKEEDLFEIATKSWQQEVLDKDRGLTDANGKWSSVNVDISDWKTMPLPANWENEGLPAVDGVVWFRKEIDLPEAWQGKELILHLSAVDDIDSTFFNGELVGSHNVWDAPRSYTIPKELVRAGKNVIAVRVQDNQGGGGIWGDARLLKLSLSDTKTIPLAGDWHYKVGLDWNELTTPALNPSNPNHPTLLSNAMIEPLIPFAIRGAIWYQGESNAGRAYQYRSLFPMMIRNWRQRWGQGDFPFLFVQLANFMAVKDEPADDSWAELREAQLLTLREPQTGMAVAIDIGDALDIHPKNKQEVGRRLALQALKIAYNQDIENSGPLYKSMHLEGKQIRLKFDHCAEGLVAKEGQKLNGFAIAAEDRHFKWAQAVIEGNEIVVWHEDIPHPVAVRYAWAANPLGNLYNTAGLPASPFRSDDWPGITGP